MRDRVPSFFMLVPGPWRDAGDVVLALRQRGVPAEPSATPPIRHHEVRVDLVEGNQLAAAFAWGRGGPLAAELVSRVAACSRAALIECGRRLDDAPREVARLGRALRDAGGVAVRMEASGSASAWEPWLEHLESEDPFRLYACAVLLVEDADSVVFTCGMHHFDLPDSQIAMPDASEARSWLDAFSVYQLAEQPALASGHTFRPSPDRPKRKLERWPDHRHSSDDGRHNPFGLWRLLDLDARGLDAATLTPVIVPALVATLQAAESAAGRPLTPSEVQDLVASSPAIAMEPRDATAFERSRGYADIEPDLAWHQWQIVRDTMALGTPTP